MNVSGRRLNVRVGFHSYKIYSTSVICFNLENLPNCLNKTSYSVS